MDFIINRRIGIAFLGMFLMVFATGCSSKVTIQANPNKSQDVEIKIDLGKHLLKTINDLTQGLGQFMDGEEIPEITAANLVTKRDIENTIGTQGAKNISVANPSKEMLDIKFSLDKNSKLKNFIEQTDNSLSLNLSGSTLQEIYFSFDEDDTMILDLLMAPCFTGEEISAEDYADVIETLYGRELANDLRTAKIDWILVAPKGVKSRTFQTTVLDFLTLTGEKKFDIQW